MEATQNTNAPISLSEGGAPAQKRRSPWQETLNILLHNRSAMLGLIIISLLTFIAIFAPVIAPYDPIVSVLDSGADISEYNGPTRNYKPCIALLGCDGPQHIMGLDQNSRDIFSRIIFGARNSLYVGIGVVAFAMTVGTNIGLIAGYVGGWVDNVIMRLMDVMLAFPSLLLAIAIVTVRGPGLQNALFAIGIVSIPVYARLSRASILSLKEQDFVLAERALGAGHLRIVLRHILPNALTPLIVQGTLGVGTAVIEAAGLAFLSLGAQPPQPEWGYMLSESRNLVFTQPHLVLFPGIAITITVLGFNLLGDGLRDTLDPRLRGTH